MNALATLLLAQIVAGAQQVPPVLAFPEPGLDDSTAYLGYRTRFFQDAARNAVQIYINQRHGRVVNLWADAANASASFSARNADGLPANLAWGSDSAAVGSTGGVRWLEYDLWADTGAVEIGAFVLGSMRLERDFQYGEHHLQPFGSAHAEQPELVELITKLDRLPPAVRGEQLELLRVRNPAELRARLTPTVQAADTGARPAVRVEQPTFDGRNRLALQLSLEEGTAEIDAARRTVTLRPPPGRTARIRVRIETDAPTLGPLRTEEIFNAEFFAFYSRLRQSNPTAPAVRRLDRQIRSMQLVSYEEKLMAGLPNYATYFGRDMLMSALMLEPVWSPAMLEHVIAAVLRKLGPAGDVSHEEALGGQAIRENAADYNAQLDAYFAASAAGEQTRADSLLERARRVLADLQLVRENYHMVDDDFQFPVLVARYLGNPSIDSERKRSFLLGRDSATSGTRLELLVRNLDYVLRSAQPYARDATPSNLISFARRPDGRWAAQSWRDSGAGYGNGRFAMDINVIWVPQALQATDTIFRVLRSLGLERELLAGAQDADRVREYASDGSRLAAMLSAWRGARRHFQVELSPDQARARALAYVITLPPAERQYWTAVLGQIQIGGPVRFLAVSLDSTGLPVPVVNTDPATELFLRDVTGEVASGALMPDEALRQLEPFLLPYPLGLFVPNLGPLVANDAYASREVQSAFRQDLYHSPRVVWGREVNLLLLGLTRQISSARYESGRVRDPRLEPYVERLETALATIRDAVEGSGLKHNELWTYTIQNGTLVPVRYGASTDIQLWNLTDLAVQFALDRLGIPGR